MRRFFIQEKADIGTICHIEGPDAKHVKTVLRMNPGDEIWLFDGMGMEYRGIIRTIRPACVDVEIVSATACPDSGSVEITIAQAMLKDRKMDTLVRQLTELGIKRWLPVITHRSVPRPDSRRIKSRMERWQTIAQESLKQCGRGFFPELLLPVHFSEALSMSNDHDLSIIFTNKKERPLGPLPGINKGENAKVMLMLGPEGGFTDQEIALALEKGLTAAGLGPRVLKADTATLAATAIVQHLLGEM